MRITQSVGQMVDECGIIKPNSEMEESEEMAECQERVLDDSNTSSDTGGNER